MWYYANGSERIGPLSEEEFSAARAAGAVQPDTLVWREGMEDWQPWGAVSGDGPASPVPPMPPQTGAMRCPECGESYPAQEMSVVGGSVVCPNCRPLVAQRVQSGNWSPGNLRYAGFWVRVVAKFIDSFICSMAYIIVPIAAGGDERAVSMFATLAWLAGVVYTIYLHGRYGATLGKMAVGIRVQRADGSAISFGRAAARYVAEWLSGFLLCLGYLMAAFDSEKRALHDYLCDTRVVHK